MKRRPPIAKSLVKNSIAAIFAAIEIHNKPIFSYRYEVAVLLFINAWELLLKAYLYKYQKKVKLFDKDNNSKPFSECVRCVTSNLDKNYKVLEENLVQIYKYRNEIAHFHIEDLDLIAFSLLYKNLLLYKKFILTFFNKDITLESDLILLPIGFKKPFSPIDFLSNNSFISKASKYVKDFIGDMIASTAKLSAEGIQESIFVEFNMNLINEKRTKNADIIAGINNEKKPALNFLIKNIIKRPTLSDDAKATLVKSNSFTVSPTTEQEEISSWIALRGKDPKFVPSNEEVWRIYSIRDEVFLDVDQVLELTRISALKEVPVFYWLQQLKREQIKEFLINMFKNTKNFAVKTYILHISAFLGKSFYFQIFSKFSKNESKRLKPQSHKFPSNGPRELFENDSVKAEKKRLKIKTEEEFKKYLYVQVNSIAKGAAKDGIGVFEKFQAWYYDCYLYAKNDFYKGKN